MSPRPGSCGRSQKCVVCSVAEGLVGDGAKPIANGTVLAEDGCRLDVRIDGDVLCQTRLRIDVPTAAYRMLPGGAQRRICDYAIVARGSGRLVAVVVELKSGVAKT